MAEQVNEARRDWYRRRIEAIHERVTAFDVLRHNGIDLVQSSDDREEQISCPFHGADKKPSARVYPEEGDSKSHVWCFVCQEKRWDAIGLWQKFNGGRESMSLSQVLKSIEVTFGLETPDSDPGPDAPAPKPKVQTQDDKDLESFKTLYLNCERRLLSCRPAYQYLEDMFGYLTAGSILDKVKFRVDKGVMPPTKGTEVLNQLLERIREKVKQCPVG